MAGTLATYRMSTAPPYISAADPILVHMSGTGPNLARQQSSHPHQVVMHPDRQELLVPDLGADKTWRFARDDNTGSWNPIGAVHYPAGSGPRHVALHGTFFSPLRFLNA
jgi:6-phosphogluconolactonase (cycloisomerase 2 family)